MVTTGAGATERVRSIDVRLAQLRERKLRLRAGDRATPEDARRARASAEAQLAAVTAARARLLSAQLAAIRSRRAAEQLDPGPPGPAPADTPVTLEQLSAENDRLRRALVTLQTYGPDADGLNERRRRALWQALVDQGRNQEWQSWAYAVCSVAVDRLPGVRGAALTLYDRGGQPYPLAASDAWTQRVEEAHLLLGEGPAIDAYVTECPVHVDDVATAYERWPGFVAVVAGTGLRALSSLPLPLDAGSAGSLTLYRSEPALPDDGEAALLASVAARALVADLDALVDEEVDGLDPYADVHVAAGVLAERLGVDVDEALAQLRAAAFSSGQGLIATAHEVLRKS